MLGTLSGSIDAWISVSPVRATVLRYAATILVMLAAIGLCTLSPFRSNAWIIIIVTVLACSWFGGVGPSLLAPLLVVFSIRIVEKGAAHVLDFSTKEFTDLVVFLLLTAAVGWSGQVRRRAQALVRRQSLELLEEARRKDRFLATLAHELRNPLAPLRTGLELLLKSADDPADPRMVREVHEMMQRQVNQLVRLIDDLLDVSRINSGKIELRRECVDLADIIQDAIDSTDAQMRASQHRLDVASAGPGLLINADPVRISQVLLNILQNAAKFTPPGGHIQVSTGRVGDLAEIRVRDDGVGIPAEMLSDVFDRFTQVDGPRDRSYGGLGIGLNIVRTLVQMHDGTVTAHSEGANRGSEFVVRLPLSPNGPPSSNGTAGPSQSAEGTVSADCTG